MTQSGAPCMINLGGTLLAVQVATIWNNFAFIAIQ